MTTKTKKKRAPMEREKIEDSGLTIKQEQVAVALAMGWSIKSIEETYDVTHTTLYAWRQQPAFIAHLRRLQRETVREIRGQLSELANKSIETISGIIDGGGEQARLKAACYVLDFMAGEQRDAKKLKQKLVIKNVGK